MGLTNDIGNIALTQVWEMIQKSHLVLKEDAILEIYHHSGVSNFHQTGAVFIKIINREYCKSYGIVLSHQNYPSHYHKIKIETFYMLYGDLIINCEGQERLLKPGNLMTVERGQSHSFYSETGAVFEELSTTYIKNDSIYEERSIREQPYSQRKTQISLSQFKELIESGQSK